MDTEERPLKGRPRVRQRGGEGTPKPPVPHPPWRCVHRLGRHLSLVTATALAVFAVAACTSSSSSAPKVSASTTFEAGLAALRQHDYSAAEQLLSQVTKREPRDTAAYYDLGVAYQDQGADRNALVAYAKAQALDERSVPVLYNRAILYSKADPQLALFLYRRVISLQHDSPTAFLNLGLLETTQGPRLHNQAEQDLAKAVQLDPSLASQIPAPLRAGMPAAGRGSPKPRSTASPRHK